MPHLAFRLFGSPSLEIDGVSIAVNRRKVLAVLAYLTLTPHSQRREHLAALFWPGYDQSTARGNLRRALSTLNGTLNGTWLQIDREQVSLRRDDDFWTDVDQFHSLLIGCRYHGHPGSEVCAECLDPLGQAVALYRDDLLTGFTLPDSPEFDDWQVLQTESLRRELTEALEKLVCGYSDERELERAISFARRWLAIDPLQESAHRQLMRLLTLSGERNAALAQYENCRQILDTELGLEPTPETIALSEQIRAGTLNMEEQGRVEADYPTGSRTTRRALPRHNLPDPATPFVGRTAEVNEITRLLVDEPACRLLTLVGPGGIGKTRLALQAATHVVEAFSEGARYVPLAPVFAVESVISAVAQALSVPLTSAEPKSELLDRLAQSEMLLVLDNFEQLIPVGGTDLLSEMSRAAPGVKLLVTSRERLNVQAEWGVDVGGLRYPEANSLQARNWQELETFDAVQLFVEHARRARPGFALSSTNGSDVVRICQMVEGMPLGLELTAAWLRMMSCREIIRESEQSLDFLTSALRDVPERHRSLRAVFDQSWGLMSESERAAFRKLTVFRGGFRRSAAERIAGASLPILAGLVDKSILRRTRAGRYEVHELLRQYAAEKLDGVAGEREKAQDRHSEYYLSFVAQRAEELKGMRQKEALAEIAVDIDNVRTAWRRAVVRRNVTALGKSAEGYLHFSNVRGWFQEGATAFGDAVQSLSADSAKAKSKSKAEHDNIVLAQLRAGEGWFQGRLGRLEPGQEQVQQSVSLLRQAEPSAQPELAHSLYLLTDLCIIRGRYRQTEEYAQQLLDISRELGDRWGVATSLWFLSAAATYQGEYLKAKQLLDECDVVLREVGEPKALVDSAMFRGILSRMLGEYGRAIRILEDALAPSRDLVASGYILRELGYAAIAMGNYRQGRKRMRESLTIFREVRFRLGLVFPLDGLGSIARLTGEYELARRQHGECLAICREIGENRGIAVSLSNLGRLAYDQQEFQEAEQLQQQSLAGFEELGHKQGMAIAMCHLGYAIGASGSTRHADAGRYFRRSLKLAFEIGAVPVVLDALAGYAHLLSSDAAGEAELEEAIVMLSMVQRHPASEQETKDRASSVLRGLASRLAPSAMAKAQNRRSARSLDSAVRGILELDEFAREGGALHS